MLKKYKDFINKGAYNKVLYLDDDWVVKMPLSKKEIDPDMEKTAEEILKKFKEHEFLIDNIDIHDDNVGIDKDGNIKLLDF